MHDTPQMGCVLQIASAYMWYEKALIVITCVISVVMLLAAAL